MKTKKLLIASLLFVGVASITSCKKVYSCECKSTFTIATLGTSTETTVDAYSEKMKEAQAKSACSETEKKLKNANDGHAQDIEYLTSNKTTVTSSCTVK